MPTESEVLALCYRILVLGQHVASTRVLLGIEVASTMWLSDCSAGSARKTKAKMLSDLSRTRDDLGRGFCSSRSTLFVSFFQDMFPLFRVLISQRHRRSIFVLFSSIFFCICKTYLNASCQTELFGNHTEDVGKFDCFQISHILCGIPGYDHVLRVVSHQVSRHPLQRREFDLPLFTRHGGSTPRRDHV